MLYFVDLGVKISRMFSLKDYSYDLPQKLIAQTPASKRDESRLLTVNRAGESFSDNTFLDLPELLLPNDLLVVNNTRVVPARIFGKKDSGGVVEVLVLEHPGTLKEDKAARLCLLKSSKRPKPGTTLFFESSVFGVVKEVLDRGLVRIQFSGEKDIDLLLSEKGRIPLPPYIKRQKNNLLEKLDKERYQTVYAEKSGAIAAPTAGLHFTDTLIKNLKRKNISIVSLTLHVGYGTFQPVKTRDIRKHELGEEYFHIGTDTADKINLAKRNGQRVIAVGTTVVRALETSARGLHTVAPESNRTGLLITPGFSFGLVDGMITNFHLPESSLLFLVSAFAGLDLMMRAYRRAVQLQYRFYSYGDAMLIL